jgi:arylsulfatase
VLNKSWTITAEVDLPDAKTNGMIVTDGGGMGKGGTVTLTANGKKVAEGRLARTVPNKLSICEGLDIGMDNGSPVDFTYKMPFAFTGKIEKVTIELKPEVAKAPRAGRRRRAAPEAAARAAHA